MPLHAVLGVTAITVACIAAALSLIYVASISSRRALRWPVVVGAVVAVTCVAVAGEVSKPLLDAVEATGSAAEVAAAQAHGDGSGALLVSLICLVVAVVATVWNVLRPSHKTWNPRMTIAAVIVALAACATIATAGVVLVEALNAVAIGHPSWGTH